MNIRDAFSDNNFFVNFKKNISKITFDHNKDDFDIFIEIIRLLRSFSRNQAHYYENETLCAILRTWLARDEDIDLSGDMNTVFKALAPEKVLTKICYEDSVSKTETVLNRSKDDEFLDRFKELLEASKKETSQRG